MKKSERPRNRYVLFEVLGEEPENFENWFYKEFMKFFGEYGFSRIGFKLIQYKERKGILRCRREYVEKVIGFLALIKEPRVKSLKTSGTIKKLRNFLEKG